MTYQGILPAFRATMSADVPNVTGNNTNYTVACNTEDYDVTNNYNNSTYTFTAPSAGKYAFAATVFAYGFVLGTDAISLFLANSAGTALQYLFRVSGTTTLGGNLCLTGSAQILMATADTAKLIFSVNGEGADVIDVQSGVAFTSFSGHKINI